MSRAAVINFCCNSNQLIRQFLVSFQMEFQYHFMKMEGEKRKKNEVLIKDQ
jgi:hypothetical protein